MSSTYPAHQFAPHERPGFPGSPFSPAHPVARRVAYAAVGVLAGTTAALSNALVNVNLSSLAGGLGVYVADANLLVGAYVAANACANLFLVKARTQFGILATSVTLLAVYIAALCWQLAFPSFTVALLARIASGFAASGLTTLTIYNLMQAMPAPLRLAGVCIGISITQLGVPLARLFPVDLLAISHWRGLELIDLALALLTACALLAVPLPPNERQRVFEWPDFLTLSLWLPGICCLCAVLSVGRYYWWTDTPVLGLALCAAVVLIALTVLLELHRARPLIRFDWIATQDMFRYALVALLVRFALAEQTYGAVGLLSSGGLNNDQLRLLFLLVFIAMLVGTAVAAACMAPERLPYMVLAAALFIALGAWIDSSVTNLSRPPQLMLSQALIGFGSALFVGPALIYGFGRLMQRGPDHMVTLVVLFSTTQNLGGLLGSSVLSSLQFSFARQHAAALSNHLIYGDPQTAARLQAGAAALASRLPDPAVLGNQASAALLQALNREADVLAYADVFRLICAVALAVALYISYIIVHNRIRRRQNQPTGSQA
ncbi:MAG: MFS transporter [Pseudomonadota bacterium]